MRPRISSFFTDPQRCLPCETARKAVIPAKMRPVSILGLSGFEQFVRAMEEKKTYVTFLNLANPQTEWPRLRRPHRRRRLRHFGVTH
jgi:hypothetical protein